MFSASVLQHPLKPSLRFGVALLLMHAIAAGVVLVTDMPIAAKLVMLPLVLLSLAYYLLRDVFLLAADSWREISLSQKSLGVISYDGSSFLGLVSNQTFVSPYFIVLCVRVDGRRLPIFRVIFPDALNAGEFRELCVHLRLA